MNLEEMLTTYRDMKAELQPAIDQLAALEKKIKVHVLETGEVCQIDGAAVSIRNGYTRASWDGKALEGFAAAHPEIKHFCKETTVGASVTIKTG